MWKAVLHAECALFRFSRVWETPCYTRFALFPEFRVFICATSWWRYTRNASFTDYRVYAYTTIWKLYTRNSLFSEFRVSVKDSVTRDFSLNLTFACLLIQHTWIFTRKMDVFFGFACLHTKHAETSTRETHLLQISACLCLFFIIKNIHNYQLHKQNTSFRGLLEIFLWSGQVLDYYKWCLLLNKRWCF